MDGLVNVETIELVWEMDSKQRVTSEWIEGLAERIENLGMQFGLWIEPEMVNKDSDLYRQHPDWIVQTPGRTNSHGRNQYVLDFQEKRLLIIFIR